MTTTRVSMQKITAAKPGEHPQNVNSVSLYLNLHPLMRSAPIELHAGCSWASLDTDGARALIQALTSAIKEIERE